jgi:hypothetical protein
MHNSQATIKTLHKRNLANFAFGHGGSDLPPNSANIVLRIQLTAAARIVAKWETPEALPTQTIAHRVFYSWANSS